MKITEQEFLDALQVVRAYQVQLVEEIQDISHLDKSLFYDLKPKLTHRTFSSLRENKIKTLSGIIDVLKNGEIRRFRRIGSKSITELLQLVKDETGEDIQYKWAL